MSNPSQLHKKSISLNNTLISLFSYGQGSKSILILHGFGSSIQSWQNFIQLFDPTEFTIYFPELPGFGSSDHPPKAWHVQDYTDTILELISTLPIKPDYLLCHSFGGRISIQLLTQHPELFKKAIFTAAAGIRPKLNFIQKLSNKLGPKLEPLKKIGSILQIIKIVRKMIGAGDYNQVYGTMQETFINVVNTDLTDLLPNIQTPTLLVWGDQDTLTPIYMGEKMHELIPNSDLKIYPGLTHGIHLKAAKQLQKDTVEFLKK